MRLVDILTESRVTVRLGAVDKPSALRAMAALLNQEDLDETEIVHVFERREALASTGVGSGVAFPHGDLPDLPGLIAAVGISEEGFDFDALDGQPVHIVVALLGPSQHRGEHLKALARFSRLLRSQAVRDRLMAAADPAEAYAIIASEDRTR